MKRIRTSELLITGGQKEITVTIVDEGAGPFLRIYTDADGFALDSERQDAIRLDFEEFHVLAGAVARLEADWADELAATAPQDKQQPPGGGGGAPPIGGRGVAFFGPTLRVGGAGGGDDR